MMPIRFDPIIPRRRKIVDAAKVQRQLEAQMRAYTADTAAICATYEAPPSPDYLRTMTLARSWSKRVFWRGRMLVGIVGSSRQMAPYNIYVRGPKGQQAAHMAARGWKSVSQIAGETWPKAEKRFRHIIQGAGN